jgi:hypothetical protein
MDLTSTLYLPIPSRIHPDVESVSRGTLAWTAALGLLEPGSVPYRRFARTRFPWLAARCWPDVSRQALQLASDWIAFVFLVDDEVDEQAHEPCSALAERLELLIERCSSLFRGARLRADEAPLGRAAASLRRRIERRFPHYEPDLFVQRATGYLRALAWEHDNRRLGRTPTLAEYTKMRIPAGGVLPCLALSLLDETDASAVRSVTSDVFVQMLELAACHHVSWTNDLHSFEKEEQEGNSANMVLILERELALDRGAAVRETVRRVDAEMHAFQRLLRLVEPHRSGVTARYVKAMLSGMRGAADWHAEGHRSRTSGAGASAPARGLVTAA